jgi:hypothetical protein
MTFDFKIVMNNSFCGLISASEEIGLLKSVQKQYYFE